MTHSWRLDWLIGGDDDTFFFFSVLLPFLESLDNRPLFLGSPGPAPIVVGIAAKINSGTTIMLTARYTAVPFVAQTIRYLAEHPSLPQMTILESSTCLHPYALETPEIHSTPTI